MVLLIVEDDPALCPHARRSGARQRLQGARRRHRRRRPGARQRLSPDRRLARRVPAGHAGLDRAEPAQAEPGHAPHSRADRHPGGGSPARSVARRLLVHHQAGEHRGPAERARRASGTSASRGASGCWSSRTTPPSASASPSCSDTTTSTSSPPTAAPTRWPSCEERGQRLRGPRSAAAGHERLRGPGEDARRRAARRHSRHRLHRPRAVGRGGGAAAHDRAQRRRQGCRIARAAARRDRALPAPAGVRPAAGEAAHARAAAQLRRGSGRPHRAAGRRRRAQHLRAEQRARAPRHARADGHDRQGGDRHPASRRPRSPSR